MFNTSLDILNLEWPHSDRDLHIVIPTLVYLEKKYNLKYKTKSIFNGYYYILKYKPKVLVLSNYVGSGLNYSIASIAYTMGIKVVSFISEGNFKEEEVDLYLYGKDYKIRKNELVIDKYLLWNERSKQLVLNKYSKLDSYLSVCGATGFDRYKLLTFINKDTFLDGNNLKYSKVIGIAGWAFGIFFSQDREYYLNTYGKEQVLMHCDDFLQIKKIYKNIIVNNPDILFILRYHPATSVLKEDEFDSLNKYNNVYISSYNEKNHYTISELINICDLWIGYETTTALEAWLLNKQTFLINPTKSDFIRENIHRGSPIVKNENEVQLLINEYYLNNAISAFLDLKSEREKIIKETIEYDDGKNYIRSSIEIVNLVNSTPKRKTLNIIFFRELFKQVLKIVLSKTLFQNKWSNLKYRSDFANKYKKLYSQIIDA